MIWTLILSFNSSVWLHLTLYIAWEQSSIPQHSSTWPAGTPCPSCCSTGGRRSTKAKNPTLQRFPFCICGWQSLIFLGGAESGGEVAKEVPFIPKWFPQQPKFQLGPLELRFVEGERICFALLKESEDFGVFPGFLSPNPSPIPAFGPQIHPWRQLLEWGLTEGWACGS